jgi:hypothetical protein
MTRNGPLPDFLVIGAMKAGTTTLYDHLSRHPEVGMSREKETDFLLGGTAWAKGESWYRGQFPAGRRIYGEASPNYTKREAFGGVPERAAALIPAARLVFLARDPVERAASQYRHALFHGVALPLPEALSGTAQMQHLIDTSRYAAQLDPWLAHYRRDDLLVLSFERLVEAPGAVLAELAAFLGIDNHWPGLLPDGSARAANSGAALARTPPWAMRLARAGAVSRLRDALPVAARARIKALLQRGPARSMPHLSAANRAEIAAAVAADATRFRGIAGLPFDGWSV